MIIGPNYVFIQVPRTASTSIASWLIAHHGGVSVGDQHSTEIPEADRGKFTFTIIRDPYDRLPSLWRYLATRFWPSPRWRASREAEDWLALGMPFDSGLPDFVDWAATQPGHQWCSQAEMLRDVRLDAILRFEDLMRGVYQLPFIGEPYQLDLARIPHLNETIPGILNEMAALAIMRHSEQDFGRFGYGRIAHFRTLKAGVL
jgi:hypothetical protein